MAEDEGADMSPTPDELPPVVTEMHWTGERRTVSVGHPDGVDHVFVNNQCSCGQLKLGVTGSSDLLGKGDPEC